MSGTKTQRKESKGNVAQIDKFREAAREHETDDSEEKFDRVVKSIAKPVEKKGQKD